MKLMIHFTRNPFPSEEGIEGFMGVQISANILNLQTVTVNNKIRPP